MVGFWSVEEKSFGPVQAKVTPAVSVVAESWMVPPRHGESAEAETLSVLSIVEIGSVAEDSQPWASLTVTV